MTATIIAVVGSGGEIDQVIARHATDVGRLIAERGWALVTGGKGGVMAAASRGARNAGGTVIGILPEHDCCGANPHLDFAIATGLGEARNAVIATCCHAMIAVGGEYGTLSEVALALKLRKPVAAIASPWGEIDGVIRLTNADESILRIASILARASDS